jgi:hypothetical protein
VRANYACNSPGTDALALRTNRDGARNIRRRNCLQKGNTCMKMRHVVIAASTVLLSSAAFAGGQKQSQSSENPGGQAQSQAAPQAQTDASTIRQAQDRLRSEGYAATPEGLREFQEAKGLQPSGQLDQQTLAALGVGASAGSGASSEGEKTKN